MFERTRCFHYWAENNSVNKRRKRVLVSLTTQGGVCGLLKPLQVEDCDDILTLVNAMKITSTRCEVNIIRK